MSAGDRQFGIRWLKSSSAERSLLVAFAALSISLSARADDPQRPTAPQATLAAKAFRGAAAAVAPSLVTIEGYGGTPTAESKATGLAAGEGPTTGVIVSADGEIVTSTFNLAQKPPVITVVLRDGTRLVARLLGRDDTRQLCLLKVDSPKPLSPARLAPRGELKVGQWAIAVGLGFGGDAPAVSAGIVSATERIGGRAIQTDANISPINYGGPLVDLEGRVLGICTPLSPQPGSLAAGTQWYNSGIGFAVSLDGEEKLLSALRAGKTIRPAFLGVQSEAAPDREGALVKEVVADSPAAKAGLKKGDRIAAIDDVAVLDPVHLGALIHRRCAGDEVNIALVRDDKTQSVHVIFGEPPAQPAPPKPGNKQPPRPMPPKPQQ